MGSTRVVGAGSIWFPVGYGAMNIRSCLGLSQSIRICLIHYVVLFESVGVVLRKTGLNRYGFVFLFIGYLIIQIC